MVGSGRYLSVTAVAEYVGISKSMVDILVRRGVLPVPIELTPRMKRWDRLAIDAALCGSTAPAGSSHASVADITREIANGILAEGRLSAAKAARRRVG